MKAAGLNTVETYVAWNIQEPERGVFNFEGYGNIERFIELCRKHDLYVILRPGPYICAEWEFGGIPYWVLENPNMVIRSNNELWKKEVIQYFDVLLAKVRPHLYINGGNILMVQVENEYGLYACDQSYMKWLYDYMISRLEPETIMFTTDPAGSLKCGTIEETFTCVDFGVAVNPKDSFNIQKQYNKAGPYFNSEFYPGWLSHWESPFQRVDTNQIVSRFREMLEMNASVNFYMFLGGSNWGFYAGANGGGDNYEADTTSYDYDAPLTEAGDVTDKYLAIRDYLKSYLKKDLPEVPKNTTKAAYGNITFTEGVSLFESLYNQGRYYNVNNKPRRFEQLQAGYGYVLYRSNISGSSADQKLEVKFVRDRVLVYLNQQYKGVIIRTKPNESINLGKEGGVLELLVENMGRLNFDPQMQDPKGIDAVYVDDKEVENWEMITLPMDSYKGLTYKTPFPQSGPVFYHTTLQIRGAPADTFFNMKGWHKGHILVNGFNIGRFWEAGPQFTIYVPAPVLKEGYNDIVVFEQIAEPGDKKTLISQHYPILG